MNMFDLNFPEVYQLRKNASAEDRSIHSLKYCKYNNKSQVSKLRRMNNVNMFLKDHRDLFTQKPVRFFLCQWPLTFCDTSVSNREQSLKKIMDLDNRSYQKWRHWESTESISLKCHKSFHEVLRKNLGIGNFSKIKIVRNFVCFLMNQNRTWQ